MSLGKEVRYAFLKYLFSFFELADFLKGLKTGHFDFLYRLFSLNCLLVESEYI